MLLFITTSLCSVDLAFELCVHDQGMASYWRGGAKVLAILTLAIELLPPCG
jgi:hypothetical protein